MTAVLFQRVCGVACVHTITMTRIKLLLALSFLSACGADAPPPVVKAPAGSAMSAPAPTPAPVAAIAPQLDQMMAAAKPTDTIPIGIWVDPGDLLQETKDPSSSAKPPEVDFNETQTRIAVATVRADLTKLGITVTGDLAPTPIVEAEATPDQ